MLHPSLSPSARWQSHTQRVAGLTLGAVGIVFGDIGTSPLYAVDQIFYGPAALAPTPANIIGCISLVVWSLILIVGLKYAAFVLRANSDGEGGVFALYSLLHRHRGERVYVSVLLGALMLGAGFLFGDGIITPAISVLSAVEGLAVVSPNLAGAAIPMTLAILVALFAIQRRGTAGVGRVFGPVLFVWFVVIAVLGARQIVHEPAIMRALNPVPGITFLLDGSGHQTLLTLGALMLVVTGGEAMYADLGHFGPLPIRIGWFAVAFPALVLNYLGQGALMLAAPPAGAGKLFYSMVPVAGLIPMVMLATVATVIASQALISGAFSLASQAIALGLFPRLKIVHTHVAHEGQIYIPFVNWSLFAGCVVLVLAFGSSGSLAAAYGLAVSGVMVVTSLAMIPIALREWRWRAPLGVSLFGFFTLVNVVFCAACLLKFLDGGYIPLGIGVIIFAIMRTWRWGRKATFAAYTAIDTMTMQELVARHRNEGTYLQRIALLMTPKQVSTPEDTAPALLQMLADRNGVLPRHLIFVEVAHAKTPYAHDGRYDITVFHKDERSSITAVRLNFGFMEEPNVEAVLEELAQHETIALPLAEHRWIVHVSVENLLPGPALSLPAMMRLKLFWFLRQISQPAHYFYGLGDNVQLSAEIFPVRLRQ